AGIFSFSQFISDLLSEKGVAVERTEGIPAFVACAARMNLPLILKDEELLVTSGDKFSPDTVSAVTGGRTVVVMKPSLNEAGIKEMIRTLPGGYVHYFENMGMPGTEYTTSDREEILRRPFPYFSILIFRKS
ncbi:MAG: SAM-dependent methyltransferase, partial [Rikenellaceae bacterium]|nr:SAM-dependent methyltransferase [Rikenellaceae bacterium]